MSLLVDLIRADEGYAAAAARRRPGRPAHRCRGPAALAVLAAAGLLIGVAAAQTQHRAPAVARARQALVDAIDRDTNRIDAQLAQLTRTQREVDAARDARLSASTAGRAVRAQVSALSAAAGLAGVTGPGVVVRLDDAPAPTRDPLDTGSEAAAGDDGRVLDADVQDVVNALWAAGAEAIAVNSQRLISTSAIRSAGEAILVDFRPLSPPYDVAAIGDPQALRIGFADSATAARLATYRSVYGLRSALRTADRLDLPAAASTGIRRASPAGGAR